MVRNLPNQVALYQGAWPYSNTPVAAGWRSQQFQMQPAPRVVSGWELVRGGMPPFHTVPAGEGTINYGMSGLGDASSVIDNLISTGKGLVGEADYKITQLKSTLSMILILSAIAAGTGAVNLMK